MKPQHFDILGIFAFLYIIGFASYALMYGGEMPTWSIVVLGVIGIIGLLVDASIVKKYFFRKK